MMRPAPLRYIPKTDRVELPVAVEAVEPVATELRAIDCTTTKQWEQRARERREYDDPMGYERSRY